MLIFFRSHPFFRFSETKKGWGCYKSYWFSCVVFKFLRPLKCSFQCLIKNFKIHMFKKVFRMLWVFFYTRQRENWRSNRLLYERFEVGIPKWIASVTNLDLLYANFKHTSCFTRYHSFLGLFLWMEILVFGESWEFPC